MSTLTLSRTDDWELENESQDVRGWPLKDETNTRVLGTVDNMVIDTDEERVQTLVLDDGREIPAKSIQIDDGFVYLKSDAPLQIDAAVHDAFRSHASSTYDVEATEYARYEPAYRYGYRMARDPRFEGHAYAEAEQDLMAGFTEHYPKHAVADYGDAVRYGYEYRSERR